MIHIEAVWLAVESLDMRAGPDFRVERYIRGTWACVHGQILVQRQ